MTRRLLSALSAAADPRPAYPPDRRRPRHALVSGERFALCGSAVTAIAPGGFDPGDQIACPRCRASVLAEPAPVR